MSNNIPNKYEAINQITAAQEAMFSIKTYLYLQASEKERAVADLQKIKEQIDKSITLINAPATTHELSK